MGWSHRTTGLIHYQPSSAYRGYTLFSPNGGDDAFLIDMEGRFVHRWHSGMGINYGFLLPNGNLLFRDRGSNPNSPGSDAIRELNWEGEMVWEYRKIKRSMSTLSITDGMVFAADYSGFVYCLDALTGDEHWVYDTSAHIWGSTLVADGKVYIGTEDGFLTVIPATKKLQKAAVKEIDFTTPIYSSPIAANGVLYVATHTHLFAIATTKEPGK